MQFSKMIMAALAVGAASAAPAFPNLDLGHSGRPADALESLGDYFNTLAVKTAAAKVMSMIPQCDVSKAKMPVAPIPLAPPTPGLKPSHVYVGRGTQNYTCDAGNSTAAPAAAGAVAKLFDVSCVAALYPDLIEKIANMAINFDLGDVTALGPAALDTAGDHFFANATTPYFHLLDKDQAEVAQVPAALEEKADAPMEAKKGQKGENAVPWLKLTANQEATADVKEVYRVQTVGGSAPGTCETMEETFEVEYVAVYWFWAGTPLPPA